MGREAFEIITNWPRDDILRLMLGYSQKSRSNPDDVILVPYDCIRRESPRDIGAKNFNRLFLGEGECRNYGLQPFEFIKDAFDKFIPYLKDLDFNGYVIAGSTPLLFTGSYPKADNPEPLRKPSDIDIFLYGDITSLTLTYSRLLGDITIAIRRIAPEARFRVTRNINCTNIYIEGPNVYPMIDKIQIIHRRYTTKQSVVVGFDQMPCQTFYDGHMVYYTLSAALAHYFGINPIDWRRESPSFVRRIEKYSSYGYVPICPYLDFSLVEEMTKPLITGDNTSIIPIYYAGFIAIEVTKRHVKYKIRDPTTSKRKTEYVNVPMLRFNRKQENGEDYYITNNDYEISGINRNTGCGFLNMSLVRKGKEQWAYVVSEDPTKILNGFERPDLGTFLREIIHGSTAAEYFDDKDYHVHLTRVNEIASKRPLSEMQLEEYCNLQRKMREIFDERVRYFESKLKPTYDDLKTIRFSTSNPGAQYSSTFNPVIRHSPQEFWGPKCRPYNTTILYEQKYETVLCIKRNKQEGVVPYNLFYRDLVNLLLEYIDRMYLSDIMNGKDIRTTKFVSADKTEPHPLYPWATSKLMSVIEHIPH